MIVSGLEASPSIVIPLSPNNALASDNFLLFLPTTVKKAPSFINAFTADFPMPDVPPTTIIFFFSNNINILLPT
ncbi:uncharacterized protein METZ01_LOCUS40515 [marine metagenome]|uniref:Uncharacterized protein n=1 Tax=marine metagenome TaxID=408172 RepID=A0A381R7E2_9ZZZZ